MHTISGVETSGGISQWGVCGTTVTSTTEIQEYGDGGSGRDVGLVTEEMWENQKL